MKKWILIAVAGVLLLIGLMETVRRMTATDDEEITAGDPEKAAAIAGQLRGNNWEKEPAPAKGDVTSLSDDQEFNQADRITDSREESLDEAKKSVGVIIKSVNEN